MKKVFSLFLLGFFSWMLTAQIITTNPAIVTNDYTGEVEIIYDATMGNAGLKDYAGTDVYAHTGVITSTSTGDTDWKHAPEWLTNTAKYKLTSLGSNKWKLIITPNMSGYYSLTTGEVIKKMAFVFRNGTGTKQGKDTGNKDIFVTVYDAGLNITFSNPTTSQSVAAGTVMNLMITASTAADLSIAVNQTVVASVTASTTLSHSYTFATAADYTIVASATQGAESVYDTIYVNVPNAVTNQVRPAGVKNGINYNNASSVTLVLHAPNKQHVFLIGEFNDWMQLNSYQMKRDGEHWWITLDNLTPGKLYGYQYLVDGAIRISDPYTELVLDPWNDRWINYSVTRFPNLKPYPSGKTEGLVATFQTEKQAYSWEVPNFTMPSRENMVIYEMLLRDFTTEQSLEAAIEKLDYLKTLGITAVELMPIQEFDGNDSWGYNPNHFFAPDKAYGTPEMYKRFIDECHKRGMAVILDVVFNHATGINPMAMLYWNATAGQTAANNPWFNVTAPHPYSVFHDYNHSYQGTRDYFKRVLQYWIQEYKVDGYRLDLTKGFTQNSSTEANASNYDQSRIDILTDYYQSAKAVKDDVMFILEHFCTYSEELELANRGMYLWRNVNNAYSQAAMGYKADSDFGAMITNPRRWVGFAESHDEERNFHKAKTWGGGAVKADSIYRVSRVPLNIAFTALTPGPKMLWQFQELGYDYSIDSQGGRTSSKPSAWGWLDLPHRKAAYDNSARIVSLRRMFPQVFTEGTYELSIAAGDWDNGRRIAVKHADLNLVVLGNFNADATVSALPNFPKTGMWYNVLSGASWFVGNATNPIELKAGQLIVLADRAINFSLGVDDLPTIDALVYPTITRDKVWVTDVAYQQEINLFNLQGQLLKSYFNSQQIDLSAYPEGIYLLLLKGDGAYRTVKVIRQN